MPSDTGLGVRIAALYAAAFAGNALYLSFFPIWLADRGFPAAEIGLILGLPIFVRAVTSSVVTAQADRAFGVRPLLLVTSLVSAAGFVVLPMAHGFSAVLLLTALAFAAQGPAGPLTDVVAIEALRRRPRLHYGRLRLWGSVAFIGATLGGGALVGWLTPASIPAMLAASALLAAAVAFAAPAGRPRDADPGDAPAPPEAPGMLRLLLLVIAATSLSHASHAMIYTFGSLSLQADGYSPAGIGVMWSVGVVAEITLFGLVGGAAGPTFPAFAYLALGAGVGIVRWLGFAAGLQGVWLVGLMALHGISFGATHLGAIGAFSRISSAGKRGRQQALFIGINATLNGLSTAACGPLYERFGAKAFLFMVPIGLASIVAAAVAARAAARRAQPQSAGEGG